MEKDEFLEDLIEQLSLDAEIQFTDDGAAQLDLTEDEWVKVQTYLDKDESLDEDEEGSSVSYESSNIQYLNEFFIINLIGDFNAEHYTINVKDR